MLNPSLSLTRTDLKVLFFLRDKGMSYYMQIVRGLGLHQYQIARSLKKLLSMGLVIKHIHMIRYCPTCDPLKVAYYSLNPEGLKWLLNLNTNSHTSQVKKRKP